MSSFPYSIKASQIGFTVNEEPFLLLDSGNEEDYVRFCDEDDGMTIRKDFTIMITREPANEEEWNRVGSFAYENYKGEFDTIHFYLEAFDVQVPDDAVIETIEDLQYYVKQGYTDFSNIACVYTRVKDNLILFCYTPTCPYVNNWNFLETISRGLVLNRITGEVVARPFDKFFNWGEKDRDGNERKTNASIAMVYEKMDGSLGILFRHNGKYHITTKGGFESEQGVWATNFLKNYALDDLPEELTLLFEIIYPDNRIVVDYGQTETLALIGARNRFNGEYLKPDELHDLGNEYNFDVREMWHIGVYNRVDHILHLMNKKFRDGEVEEGFVVLFNDGQRFKFKYNEYFKLHKERSNITKKRVLEAMKEFRLQQYLENIPTEYLEQVKTWASEIECAYDEIQLHIERDVASVLGSLIADGIQGLDRRKQFALRITKDMKYVSGMFNHYDGRDNEEYIYKIIAKEMKEDKR
jgi:RNA ligase